MFFAGTLLLAATTLGCGAQEETLRVEQWTLDAPSGAHVPLRLPAHVDRYLPASRSSYTLHAQVVVPPAFRGRPLTLTLRSFAAVPTLEVGGQPARALLADPAPVRLMHAWQLPPTTDERLELTMHVEHTSRRSAWIDAVPELSATERGPRSFVLVERWNRGGVLFSLGAIVAVTLQYLVLFAGRRRAAFGWFFGQAAAAAYVGFYATGWSFMLLGDRDEAFLRAASQLTAALGLGFTRAHFEMKRPHYGWVALGVVTGVMMLPASDGFALARLAPIGAVATTAMLAAQVVAFGFALRHPNRRRDALWLGLVYLAVATGATLEFVRSTGLGEPFGGALAGLRVILPAFAAYSLVQTLLLGRAHVESVAATDALNRELEQKVTSLLQHREQIDALNEGLRVQVAERSRELASALVKLGDGAPRSLAPGDVIDGRYKIVDQLGQGGMGAVHRVERVSDGRIFALKVLLRAGSSDDRARFAREAEAASGVVHPNIVRVIDVALSSDGLLFIVSELAEGGSLEQQRARFGDLAWARPLLAPIASALSALHAHGVVHRDLKPGNVLLDRESRPRIADFGIAAVSAPISAPQTIDVHGDTAAAPHSPRLTRTGAWLGTPQYMAPELASGARANEASDVFAFGVMAAELTTGRSPFGVPPFLDVLAGRSPEKAAIDLTDESLRALLVSCVAEAPAGRPSFAQIERALT